MLFVDVYAYSVLILYLMFLHDDAVSQMVSVKQAKVPQHPLRTVTKDVYLPMGPLTSLSLSYLPAIHC